MKKLMLLLVALAAIAVPVRSQEVVRDPHAGPIQSVGAPSGPCQSWWIDVDTTTGNFYTCNQGEWNLSSSTGTIASGAQGQPTIYTSGSAISSSNQNLDVSAFHLSGNKFTDDIVAGNTAMASGGTLIVPDSEAAFGSGAATTPTLSGNATSVVGTVSLLFPGNAVFNACTIQMAPFSTVDLGKTTLKAASGSSNCKLLYQPVFVSEQNGAKNWVHDGTIDCNGQVACTGVSIGNSTSFVIERTAIQNATDRTSTISAPTGGLVFQATQFARVVGVKFYNDYVPHKCYNNATGGGCNSNYYDNINVASGCEVGVLYGYQGTLYTPGPNYFKNLTLQNCAVSSHANFGNPSVCGGGACPSSLYIDGGAPEVNGTPALTLTFTNGSAVIGATNTLTAGQVLIFATSSSLPTNFSANTPYYVISTGLSSSQFEVSATAGGTAIQAGSAGSGTQTATYGAVIDGFTVKKSSTYVNYTWLFYSNVGVAEATVSPIIDAENYSIVNLYHAGGGAGQQFVTTDSTSMTQLESNMSATATGSGFGNWGTYTPQAIATSSANQSSPPITYCGSIWNGNPALDCWQIQNLVGTGSNPSTTFKFTHAAGGSGFYGIDMSTANQVSLPDGTYQNSTLFNVGGNLQVNGTAFLGPFQGSQSKLYDASGGTTYGTTEIAQGVGCETSNGLTTVNTGSATTTTGQSCIPANAFIDGVSYRITTTITTATSFTVGISGSTSKFCGTQSTMTAGTNFTCAAQINAGAAYSGASAVPVVVTFNATPGAGAMRIIVYWHVINPPTS